MLFSMLLMAAPAEASPPCGKAVVGSYFPTLALKNVDGQVVETIKADKGRLPEALPVVRCSETLVLVRWKGQLATVERVRARFSQAMVVCPDEVVGGEREGTTVGSTSGAAENSGNASSMGAFDPRCPARKSKPAGKP